MAGPLPGAQGGGQSQAEGSEAGPHSATSVAGEPGCPVLAGTDPVHAS